MTFVVLLFLDYPPNKDPPKKINSVISARKSSLTNSVLTHVGLMNGFKLRHIPLAIAVSAMHRKQFSTFQWSVRLNYQFCPGKC